MWGILARLSGYADDPVPPIEPAVEECAAAPTDDGHELFGRVWVAGDPRAPTGDGLGPTYNGRSCVECHNQGGRGGAGGAHTNVALQVDGPATRTTSTASMLSNLGYFDGVVASRNTPALWGAGLLDGIDDAELVAVAVAGDRDHPEITGRVARDGAGKVTRFGWKGQTATLAQFVENACANELGLETPAVRQPGTPAPGPDLTDGALVALVAEVASFPAPIEVSTPGADDGRALFAAVGCTGCHRETLGEVRGVYADLLLHDLGFDLSDETSGYGMRAPTKRVAKDTARPTEWRTPPLWGLRDSAPYLHDGRAQDVDTAIRFHDGEAATVRDGYLTLSPSDQELVQRFLASLAAPSDRSG